MRSSVIVTAAAMLLASCSSAKSVGLSQTSIADFHASLNRGEFAAIYARSSADMKNATTPQKFVALLDAVHRKLGLFKSGKSVGWNDNHTTGGELVTITHQSIYERGKAQEVFVYRISDQGAGLAGYNINLDALVLN